MAEDKETPKEEAPEASQEQEARPGRRGRKVDPPVSLYPLSFEEAVGALLEVPLESDAPRRNPTGGTGGKGGD